jgi:antitoxin (DNA-binding transcriptional repressor) of toxin-antitoxin stability system
MPHGIAAARIVTGRVRMARSLLGQPAARIVAGPDRWFTLRSIRSLRTGQPTRL